MKLSKLAISVVALALLLAGLGAGRILANFRQAPQATMVPTPTLVGTPVVGAVLPTRDVPGTDVRDLPRYPGAVRVEYRRTLQDDFVITEVEYVTDAPFDEVYEFYRSQFRARGWSVADFNFIHGEWTFLVIDGLREAIVEVESRGPYVEIEIEISEPRPDRLTATPADEPATESHPAPTAEPTAALPVPTSPPPVVNPPAPQPAPPADDDDDDDDDWDD